MKEIKKKCTECESINIAKPTKGLGGIATWEVQCEQCGTETQGFRLPEECIPGEPFADTAVFD